jgi:hypothetical protein
LITGHYICYSNQNQIWGIIYIFIVLLDLVEFSSITFQDINLINHIIVKEKQDKVNKIKSNQIKLN